MYIVLYNVHDIYRNLYCNLFLRSLLYSHYIIYKILFILSCYGCYNHSVISANQSCFLITFKVSVDDYYSDGDDWRGASFFCVSHISKQRSS